MHFEWNKNKAATNLKKHDVGFPEATTVFNDPFELTVFDPDHSKNGEYRFLSLGRSLAGNLLVVSYTEQETNQIRIISDRQATRREKKNYERHY